MPQIAAKPPQCLSPRPTEPYRITNADNDGSTKMKKPRDHCAHQDLPLGFKTPELNTFKKDRDDDDAAAKGFPRYTTRREEG